MHASALQWLTSRCQLLGSGGNDGSRDFGMNFGLALQSLYEFASGKSLDHTAPLIRQSLGFEVLRLPNMEVFNNLRAVLDVIEAAIARREKEPHPNPPQTGGELSRDE